MQKRLKVEVVATVSSAASFEASQSIFDVPYAKFADLIGLVGIEGHEADDVGPAWDRALAA